MSTEYFGVNTPDPARIGELVENRTPPADITPIDVKAMRALLEKAWLKGAPGEPMRFEKNGSRVTVYISAASVQLAHTNSGDFDDIMDVVMKVQMTMTGAGLNVWDPQQGSWFPGSPVLEEKKGKPNATVKKRKPVAKLTPRATVKNKVVAKAKPKKVTKSKRKSIRSRSPRS